MVLLLDVQVWAGIVPVGPCGVTLNSSYANRDSREYKEDLGYAQLFEKHGLSCAGLGHTLTSCFTASVFKAGCARP